MSRPRKWPPTIYPHPGSGQDRIRVGGVDYYLGPIGSEQARQEYARLINDLAGLPPPVKKEAPLTVAGLLERWRAEERERFSPDTQSRTSMDRIALLLEGCLGSMLASEVKAAQLRQFRQQLIGMGWVRSTINRNLTRVKTIWRWAEEQGLVPPGAWAHLRVVKELGPADRQVPAAKPRQAATWQDVKCVIRHCTPIIRAMLLVQWYTGCRSKELRLMQAGDIDTSADTWIWCPRSHKNSWRGQSRAIPLGPRARAIVRVWLAGKSGDAYVFASARGCHRCRKGKQGKKPYNKKGYCSAIANACEHAGVKITPYQCRHAAKARVEKSDGIDAARCLLGQKTVASTAHYASQHDLSRAIELARRLG